MFAKLKKKIQEEAHNVVGSSEEKKTQKASSSGPGLASPVNKDYPNGPFFGRVQSDNSDVNGDSPERNGNRASSVEGTAKDSTNKEEVLVMLMKRTEQVKKLEAKISELAAMLKEKNRQIDKLENSLEVQHDATLQELQEMTDKYQEEKKKVSEGFDEAVKEKEHSRSDLQNKLEQAEEYREKYYKTNEVNDEMTDLTTQEMAKVKHMLLNTQSELRSKAESLMLTDKKLQESHSEVTSLMEQISTLANKSEESEETNQILTENLEVLRATKEDAETQLIEMRKKSEELVYIQQKYTELETAHGKLRTESEITRKKLESDCEGSRERALHLKERVDTLEKRLQDTELSDDEQLQALEKQRESLECRLSEAREQLAAYKTSSSHKIALLEQKVIHLNSVTTDQTREVNKSQRAVDETRNTLQREIESWKSRLQMALLEVKDKDKLIEAQKQSHDMELARRQKSASLLEDELNEQIKQLKSQLETIEKAKERDKQSAQERIAKLERGQEDWLEREIDVEKQITRLEEDLHRSKLETAEKEKDLIVLRRQLKQQEQKISAAELKRKDHEEKTKSHRDDAEKYHKSAKSFENDLHSCVKEKDDLLLRNAQLSQEFESHKRRTALELRDLLGDLKQRDSAIAGLEQSLSDLQHETNSYQEQLRVLESEQDEATDKVESDEINRLKQTHSSLEEQLTDKNKSIKMLHQRLTDLKKTLQRELKVQALPNDEPPGRITPATSNRDLSSPATSTRDLSVSPEPMAMANNSPPSLPVTLHLDTRSSPHPKKGMNSPYMNSAYARPYLPNMRQTPHDALPHSSQRERISSSHAHYCDPKDFMYELNLEYLKHVVLKFMLSREHEAVHLIKAVAMLLHFSPDEQCLIKDTLDWKMSWFGTRPQQGRGQMAKVIPPSY